MIHFEKLLMIGATGRNSGKTELASLVIREFSKNYKIIGLKVSTYYGDDLKFHGQHETVLEENFTILKDSDNLTDKNTARMLIAGASEVYWLRTKIEFIDIAVKEFIAGIDKNAFIVCESNSLRKAVKPDIFIMINNNRSGVKITALDVLKTADAIIQFNGKEFVNFDISRIGISNGKWVLNKE